MSRLITNMKVGQCLLIDGGKIRVSLEAKSGQVARLVVEAPESVSVTLPACRVTHAQECESTYGED